MSRTGRTSWDTSVKHLARHGLLGHVLTDEQIALIPRSNLTRWRNEPEDKYALCEINHAVQKELELIKRINSSKIKKMNQAYFELCDTFHGMISEINGVRSVLRDKKEIIINAIMDVKRHIPLNHALKVFNISRGTFENYKSIVVNKCDASYFQWCIKRFPNQLLPKEVSTIKKYLEDGRCRLWSKSSIYLLALREGSLKCCPSTFYKYCRLLGYNSRLKKKRSPDYKPVRTTRPNELWCADVTIFRTMDGTKHYIHFLIDHFSRKILGHRIEKSPSGHAVRTLLKAANQLWRPERLCLLTDGGVENVNAQVASYLASTENAMEHFIAQKDVIFSNSMVEAVNKCIKHQFLYGRELVHRSSLENMLTQTIDDYNGLRPQMALGGNTPNEAFAGRDLDLARYKTGFSAQRIHRKKWNAGHRCKIC